MVLLRFSAQYPENVLQQCWIVDNRAINPDRRLRNFRDLQDGQEHYKFA